MDLNALHLLTEIVISNEDLSILWARIISGGTTVKRKMESVIKTRQKLQVVLVGGGGGVLFSPPPPSPRNKYVVGTSKMIWRYSNTRSPLIYAPSGAKF